jgi:alkylhydroperoxidase family enzyme
MFSDRAAASGWWGLAGPAAPAPRVPALDDAAAWKCMPAAEKGGGKPLPVWARALARDLPQTTAAMLELDFAHRAGGPLEPKLRAKMRWVAARANRCAYAEAYAAADLRRAGGAEADVRELTGDLSGLPAGERDALAFARKLTGDCDDVTDEEVAGLIGRFGEKQVVAMVLQLAHASFQDRLLLALDLPIEAGGPREPLEVRFTRPPPGTRRAAAPRERPAGGGPPAAARQADAEWLALDYGRLQKELEKQRTLRPRIKLPPGSEGNVLWGAVCTAYQPELAAQWSGCVRAFGAETDQDPVFGETLFWVVARSLRSFY